MPQISNKDKHGTFRCYSRWGCRCQECKDSAHKYYLNRYENNKESAKARNEALYKVRSELIKEAKAVPCADCKRTYPSYVMDFDHRPEEIKLGNVAQAWSWNLDRLKEEINKCEVVCANCHRERTHKRAEQSLSRPLAANIVAE